MGKRTLACLLKQESRVVRLQDEQNYRLLGVKWYGQGAFLREEKKGAEIKADKLYQVRTGDFIYNRLFAWKRSFAIIPEDFDGCLVSNEFPTFTAVDDQIDLEFLLRYILLPQNIEMVNRVSGGMSSVSRKRFKEADFLDFSIPNIPLVQQQKLCRQISRKESILVDLESEKSQQLSFLKQLRQAVLQEAVEGKLTVEWRKRHSVVKGDPQYDAAALLTQIKTEKERLVKEGKIRKEKPLPPIADIDKPFDLPKGWVWCRLGEMIQISSGDGLTSKEMTKGGEIPVYGGNGINGYHDKANVCEQTIAIGRVGAQCGSVHLTEYKAWVTDNAFITTYNKVLNRDWLISLLVSLNLRDKARETAQPVISGQRVYPIAFPLPPLAEQQAIVARIDSLMAKIDELEKQVAERKEQAQMLMQAVLREAFDGRSADEA